MGKSVHVCIGLGVSFMKQGWRRLYAAQGATIAFVVPQDIVVRKIVDSEPPGRSIDSPQRGTTFSRKAITIVA